MKQKRLIYRIFLLTLCILGLSISLTATAAGTDTFRFAQLTDIHISSQQTKDWLRQSIDQINADSTIDFVLVTGDLTDNGDNQSLEDFARLLKSLNKPYYVISGNHETTWSESGMETFGRLFKSERLEFEHKGFLFLGFTTGPFVRMAYGHVQPQDLSWVRQEAQRKGQGKRLIIVTHYPLQEGDVDNWYQATDSLRRLNPVCLIGGHYHQNLALSYDGIPGFLGRANLRDKLGNVGYTEYDVTKDSLLVFEHNVGQPRRRWAGISLTHHYYDPQGNAVHYPDFSVNQRWPQVKEVWRLECGVGIYGTPAVEGKRCYVGDTGGRLICYDVATGKVRWTYQGSGKIVGTPAVASGVVVFGSTDHNIYGVSAKTGRLVWQLPTAEAQMGAVAIDHGIAYIAGSDHKMRAIKAKTGQAVWTYDGVGGYVVTRPLVTDGKVIFGAWDNTVYALDQHDGHLIWTWSHLKGHLHYSAAGVWPVATKEAVFVVDPERAMTAIDLQTGRQLWRTKQSKVRESLGISHDGQRLYAKTMQDSIVCYAADARAPRELWACNAGFGYEHATTMLPERDGIVYSSTKDGLIIAIEGKTGRLLWEHKVGNSFINTVVPLGKGRVLMTETTGEVALLQVQ